MSATASDSAIYGEGFEEIDELQYPDSAGWRNLAGGESSAAYISILEAYSGDKSFRLEGSPHQPRVDYVLFQASGSRLSYEAAVFISEPGRGARLGFAEQIDGIIAFFNSIDFSNDGYLYFLSASGVKRVRPYSVRTWHRVKVSLDFESRQADILLDDQAPVRVEDVYPVEFDYKGQKVALSKFTLATNLFQGVGKSVVYFDDIAIGEVLPGNIIGLLNEADAKLEEARRLSETHPVLGFILGKYDEALRLAREAAQLYVRVGSGEGERQAADLESLIARRSKEGARVVRIVGFSLLVIIVLGSALLARKPLLRLWRSKRPAGLQPASTKPALLRFAGDIAGGRIEFRTPPPRPVSLSAIAESPPSAKEELLGAFREIAEKGSAFARSGRTVALQEDVTEDIDAFIENIYDKLASLGRNLYRSYVVDQIRADLRAFLTHARLPLKLEIQGDEAQLPWEILYIDGVEDFLCLQVPVSRTPTVTTHSSLLSDVERALIVAADPHGDLSGAIRECELLSNTLKRAGLRIKALLGNEATKSNVIAELESGRCQVLHFSGHSDYNKQHPQSSVMHMHDGKKLYAHELNRLALDSGLRMVFLNSCFSASGGGPLGSLLGLSQTLVNNDIPYVIGMRWEISDQGAETLAAVFYENLQSSGDVTEALRIARQKTGESTDWKDPAWASPVLYTA